MRHSLLRLVSVAIFALLGCGSDHVVTPPEGLTGQYALETVNGLAIPFLKSESASERVEVVSGSLTLRPDRTYGGEIVEQRNSSGKIDLFPETSAGTYTLAGNQITFTEDLSGVVSHGTIDGSRLTATLIDVTFGFVEESVASP